MAAKKLCSVEGCCNPSKSKGWCGAHYMRWYLHGDPLGGGPSVTTKYGEPRRYLEENVLTFSGDECLIWPYGKSSHGYGQINGHSKGRLVHKIVCIEVNGPPPSGKHVAAHSCGNGAKGCCNPRHLRWATYKENEADKIIHGTSNRGERCGTSKLTLNDVRKIRSMRGLIPQWKLAKMFGVDQSAISRVMTGARWHYDE